MQTLSTELLVEKAHCVKKRVLRPGVGLVKKTNRALSLSPYNLFWCEIRSIKQWIINQSKIGIWI